MARRSPPRRRLLYTVGYTLMAAAGVFAFFFPARSVQSATGPLDALLVLWSIFLFVGGVTSALGSYTDRWLGEYVGLPLLAAVFGVYGVGALALARPGMWTVLAGGFAFVAIALVFMGRWAEVAHVRVEAAKQVKERHEAEARALQRAEVAEQVDAVLGGAEELVGPPDPPDPPGDDGGAGDRTEVK